MFNTDTLDHNTSIARTKQVVDTGYLLHVLCQHPSLKKIVIRPLHKATASFRQWVNNKMSTKTTIVWDKYDEERDVEEKYRDDGVEVIKKDYHKMTVVIIQRILVNAHTRIMTTCSTAGRFHR